MNAAILVGTTSFNFTQIKCTLKQKQRDGRRLAEPATRHLALIKPNSTARARARDACVNRKHLTTACHRKVTPKTSLRWLSAHCKAASWHSILAARIPNSVAPLSVQHRHCSVRHCSTSNVCVSTRNLICRHHARAAVHCGQRCCRVNGKGTRTAATLQTGLLHL